jgi:hypothetical protein
VQRAAHGAAEALVVGANLFQRRVVNRERLRVERGVGVAVEERETHAVYVLAKQPTNLSAVRSAAPAATASSKPATTATEKSALPETAASAASAAEGIAGAWALARLSEPALPLAGKGRKSSRAPQATGRQPLADRALQKKGIGRSARAGGAHGKIRFGSSGAGPANRLFALAVRGLTGQIRLLKAAHARAHGVEEAGRQRLPAPAVSAAAAARATAVSVGPRLAV